VEAKPLDSSSYIDPAPYADQVGKYLRTDYDVILTDGLDFVFYSPSGTARRMSLVSKPVAAASWESLRPDPALEAKFREFFASPGFRTYSEEELVREAATRARNVSDEIRRLADSPPDSGSDEAENQLIKELRKLREIVEQHHDPALRNVATFSNFVAQVLIFGLLYAHRVAKADEDEPSELYEKIRAFWTEETAYEKHASRLRPFHAITRLLENTLGESSERSFGAWYDDCRLLLAHARLAPSKGDQPNYHTLFERFLAAFDPQFRYDYGAFYTPGELATFTVGLAEAVAEREFEDASLYESGNRLIDPCCGTGTFLEMLVEHSLSKDASPQIVGFEILPAPYALAHYRLNMIFPGEAPLDNTHVVLTNTLSDALLGDASEEFYGNPIAEEQAQARLFSMPPLTLVIGNPPSTDSPPREDLSNFSIIEKLVEDFRPPLELRTTRQNVQQQLNDDFVWFLRWACHKLENSERGVLALILPASFAEHVSYKYARKWLLEKFPKLWVLDIDEDTRVGARTSSLFGTQQGRMLLLGVTEKSLENAEEARVSYGTIARLSRDDKRAYLSRPRNCQDYFDSFEPMPVNRSSFRLRSAEDFNEELYLRFWRLYEGSSPESKGVFQRHAAGLKLGATAMFVQAKIAMLQRRCREIADLENVSVSELKERWFSGQRKPPSDGKFSEAVRREFQKLNNSSDGFPMRTYSYRPLLNLPAMIAKPVLKELSGIGGGGTRLRPEVFSAFDAPEPIGIAVAPAPKDIGRKLHRFASFCWHLPDNDLCKRGNASILSPLFPQYKTQSASWDSTPVGNIHEGLIRHFEPVGEAMEEDADRAVVYYVYGMLCSQAYLDEFQGALFSVADKDNPPRVPISANSDVCRRIAEKGKTLALLEKTEDPVELAEDLTTMLDSFDGEFPLKRAKIKDEEGKIELFEGNRVRIVVEPIAEEVLDFRVSGYEVTQLWLRMHTYAYTRTTFKKEDYRNLLELLQCIRRQIEVTQELDEEVAGLLTGEAELISSK
jgi:hypothetical protein